MTTFYVIIKIKHGLTNGKIELEQMFNCKLSYQMGGRKIKERTTSTGLGSRASATFKPQGNQHFTNFKISWNSKPDPNIAIPI